MKIESLLLVFLGSLIFSTCRDKGVDPKPISIQISLKDVGATEAWLRLQIVNGISQGTVKITRDDQTILSIPYNSLDTVIFDDSLSPQCGYVYRAYHIYNNLTLDSSLPASIMTLDTTTHNFTWQTFFLGGGDDSWLADVNVVNQNNIWAVGKVSIRDSTGQVSDSTYNAIHWDGNDVKLTPIPIRIWNTNSYINSPIRAIYSSGSNYLCVSTGGQVVWYNGLSWGNGEFLFSDLNDTTFGGIDEFGGVGKSPIWGVGGKGNIFSFIDSGWQKIPSGTSASINDIWCFINPNTQKEEAFCAVSELFSPGERIILKLTDNKIETVEWNGNKDVIVSLWTNHGYPLYAVGGLGLYQNKTGAWEKVNFGNSNFFPIKIRGTGLNNIIVSDAFGLVAHYNGITWKILSNVYQATYSSISIKDRTVAGVGSENGLAVLTIGTQN